MTARYLVFSDGSSISNPGGPGGTGYVVLDTQSGQARFGSKRYLDDGEFSVTNNRMELRAVLEAIQDLPAGESVEVMSDSTYAIKACSEWLPGWRKRGWKTAEGKPVMNRDLIETIDARARELKLHYTWVRGHNGHAVNEVVDSLANSAARGLPGPTESAVLTALRQIGALTETADKSL